MKIEGQVNKQPTIRNLAKLLMNSMYGRFGMHTDYIRHGFLNDSQIANLAQFYQILSVLGLGDLNLVTYTLNHNSIQLGLKGFDPTYEKFMDGLPSNTNVAIAAAVTAYSRMIINDFKLKALSQGLELYYSDTDSLVINGQLPPECIDSSTLGKLEYTFREGIFVMPKVYYLELEDETTVTKCKGFSGKLTRDQYLALMKGEVQHLEVTRWVRSLANSTIQICKGSLMSSVLPSIKDNKFSMRKEESSLELRRDIA